MTDPKVMILGGVFLLNEDGVFLWGDFYFANFGSPRLIAKRLGFGDGGAKQHQFQSIQICGISESSQRLRHYTVWFRGCQLWL